MSFVSASVIILLMSILARVVIVSFLRRHTAQEFQELFDGVEASKESEENVYKEEFPQESSAVVASRFQECCDRSSRVKNRAELVHAVPLDLGGQKPVSESEIIVLILSCKRKNSVSP